MKNNRIMKAAGALLVLVLVTSCFVGSTFAKYTTAGTGTDSARVAKFGVTVTANGTMFAEEYDTHDENAKATIAKSVVSTDKVIAPGTSGDMVSMTISGTPEVAVQVNYTADVELTGSWTDKDGSFYCPLQITIGKVTIDGHKFNNKDAFIQAIETEISTFSASYAAGTDLSTITADGSTLAPSVSWTWSFSDGDDTDVKDTYLGDQAAEGKASGISVSVTTTVTQID